MHSSEAQTNAFENYEANGKPLIYPGRSHAHVFQASKILFLFVSEWLEVFRSQTEF